jgi:tetratricopeptide (TPR) repeat protein
MATNPGGSHAACPRCGQADPGPVACPRCGVIFAKIRARTAPPAATSADDEEEETRSGFPWLSAFAVVLVAVCAVAGWRGLRAPRPNPGVRMAQTGGPRAVSQPREPREAEPPPPTLAPVAAPPVEVLQAEAAGLVDEDRQKAESLARRLPAVGPGDVTVAEQLYARHPETRNLLEATLLNVAQDERRRRRFTEAAVLLQRATVVQVEAARPCLALMDMLVETGDWPGAESAARTAIAREPRNADAWHGLGFALMRQDRNTEAAEALRTALEIRPDATAQGLLDRVSKGMADERGMTEQHLSHFHVRYDGEAHEDVGREILRALERHYATLASALGHQPDATIPVILFSRDGYYDASGAPAWSGGVYDLLDGRIRVPIQGLTRSLTPDMDRTLLHELTHAFVADRTRGIPPDSIRDIQEGLAQYMEGERVTERLTPQQLTMFADGRARGVPGFYLYALSFVEYLISIRGMGGMNDLLRVMGESGSVDEAFKQVYGQDGRATKQAWFQRLHQQHGS